MQLGLVSGLGWAKGLSFNGPVWSISIEVFLYAVFFAVCALNKTRWWHLLPFVFAGIALLHAGAGALSVGLIAFFMGSLAFQTFDWIRRRGTTSITLIGVTIVALASWLVVPLSIGSEGAGAPGEGGRGSLIATLSSVSMELVVYPSTLVVIALIEIVRGGLGKRIAAIGALSYSCYLLHFPLQMIFMASERLVSNGRSQGTFFYSPVSLLLFFACLIPMSLWVNRHFEMPMQTFLRNRLLQRKVRIADPGLPTRVNAEGRAFGAGLT